MDDIAGDAPGERALRPNPLPASPVDEVHPAVRAVLLAAADESATARGSRRREAFRTARFLLAGCRILGQPRTSIAELLGVRAETIASRDTVEGEIAADTFARLAGVTMAEIADWRGRGELPTRTVELSGRIAYPAADLLAALIRHHGQRW